MISLLVNVMTGKVPNITHDDNSSKARKYSIQVLILKFKRKKY